MKITLLSVISFVNAHYMCFKQYKDEEEKKTTWNTHHPEKITVKHNLTSLYECSLHTENT